MNWLYRWLCLKDRQPILAGAEGTPLIETPTQAAISEGNVFFDAEDRPFTDQGQFVQALTRLSSSAGSEIPSSTEGSEIVRTLINLRSHVNLDPECISRGMYFSVGKTLLRRDYHYSVELRTTPFLREPRLLFNVESANF